MRGRKVLPRKMFHVRKNLQTEGLLRNSVLHQSGGLYAFLLVRFIVFYFSLLFFKIILPYLELNFGQFVALIEETLLALATHLCHVTNPQP